MGVKKLCVSERDQSPTDHTTGEYSITLGHGLCVNWRELKLSYSDGDA